LFGAKCAWLIVSSDYKSEDLGVSAPRAAQKKFQPGSLFDVARCKGLCSNLFRLKSTPREAARFAGLFHFLPLGQRAQT